ncbi:hypothetical protein SynA1524_01059 [Synechococcus sp. A15-24]|nr:hypothetical protein SynA1524_01059 [Synechococcus sp. A15-24]
MLELLDDRFCYDMISSNAGLFLPVRSGTGLRISLRGVSFFASLRFQ